MVKSTSSVVVVNPNDRYFRASMSNPEIAIPFCKKHLPEFLSEKINYSTMQVVDKSFLSKELRSFTSDCILQFELNSGADVTVDGQPHQVNVAVIVEHQSTPDKFMPFRIFHYMFGYWHEQYKQHHALTPVYPLLFYNGAESPYPYSMSLYDNFADACDMMRQVFNHPISVIDVQQLDESDLKTQNLLGIMTRAMKFRNVKEQTISYLT